MSIAPTNPLRDKTYFLHEDPLTFNWDAEVFLVKDTIVDCGPLIVELAYEDWSEFDAAIFEYLPQPEGVSSFKVRYSEDLSIQDDYKFVYRAYFRDYPDNPNVIDQPEPITITILDPCEQPKKLQPTD